MKSRIFLGMTVLVLGACATAYLGEPIQDRELGLTKTSVFATPEPVAFAYPTVDPDESTNLPRAYEGAPPQVPHEVATMLPITMKKNECMECHDKPHLIGKGKKGIAPMPESHYVKVDGKMKAWGARYVCDQCHVPQANVKPLVANTFAPPKP